MKLSYVAVIGQENGAIMKSKDLSRQGKKWKRIPGHLTLKLLDGRYKVQLAERSPPSVPDRSNIPRIAPNNIQEKNTI